MVENNEESYSMYPNTPSSPPPPHTNMKFPVYQPPTPMYVSYPQGPYMYAAAPNPSYHFKMMNQSQGMIYQGAPQQKNNITSISDNNGINNSGSKKKWNNNSNNMVNGSSNINMVGNNMYQTKGNNYYQAQHYYNSNANNNQPLINNKSNSSTALYDPFKFDISKSNYSRNIDLTTGLPLFFNTTPEEFSEARNRKYELKLKSIEQKQNISVLKAKEKKKITNVGKPVEAITKPSKSSNEVTELVMKTDINSNIKAKLSNEKQEERSKKVEVVKENVSSDIQSKMENISKKDEKPVVLSKTMKSEESTENKNDNHKDKVKDTPTLTETITQKPVKQTGTTTTKVMEISTAKPTSVETPKPAVKSWSAIASSAAVKSKSITTKHISSVSSSTTVSTPISASPSSSVITVSSKQPQKKDKNYIPPSTKGSEPLGSLALRVCFDPDFVNYTLTNKKNGENKLPVNSIIPRGIINNANICFMSSVLQVLLYCQPFIDILNVVSTRNMNSRVGEISCELLNACISFYTQFDREYYEAEKKNAINEKYAHESKKDKKTGISKQYEREEFAPVVDSVKPDEFYQALSKIPKFKDLQWGHQEDAEEFLTHLLDQLHEEFISCIDCLTENEIQNLLQSIKDEPLKIFFIRNLQRYKKATFIQNASSQFKDLLHKYGVISDDDSKDNDDDDDGWHEVSSSSKKGKKTKTAAKRTVEITPSPVSELFGGQFRSVLDIPNNKESQSITLDPFQTIQLDISDNDVSDLESAFKKFSEFELLPFKSSKGIDVEAKKQTFIDKLPQVLLIQLKRFAFVSTSEEDKNMANYNSYNGRIEKIRKKVNYPHHLTIPKETVSSQFLKFNESNRQYELSGVIYHHGVSPDGGHYTADIYHKEADKWYRIDDINITPLKPEDVLEAVEEGTSSRTAYILMYQKV